MRPHLLLTPCLQLSTTRPQRTIHAPASKGCPSRRYVWPYSSSTAYHPRTCKRLLPQQALRLAVKLLNELSRQVARGVDGLPLPDTIAHETKLQHLQGHTKKHSAVPGSPVVLCTYAPGMRMRIESPCQHACMCAWNPLRTGTKHGLPHVHPFHHSCSHTGDTLKGATAANDFVPPSMRCACMQLFYGGRGGMQITPAPRRVSTLVLAQSSTCAQPNGASPRRWCRRLCGSGVVARGRCDTRRRACSGPRTQGLPSRHACAVACGGRSAAAADAAADDSCRRNLQPVSRCLFRRGRRQRRPHLALCRPTCPPIARQLTATATASDRRRTHSDAASPMRGPRFSCSRSAPDMSAWDGRGAADDGARPLCMLRLASQRRQLEVAALWLSAEGRRSSAGFGVLSDLGLHRRAAAGQLPPRTSKSRRNRADAAPHFQRRL
eukprot:365702-Chlamydomonas_euryale.AAC.18